MIDRLLRFLCGTGASGNNQSQTWKFQTKLCCLWKCTHWCQPREFPSLFHGRTCTAYLYHCIWSGI